MKIITLFLLACCFNVTFASDSEGGKKPKFEKHKARMLDHLATKISVMTTARACANASKNNKDLKKCHAPLKEMREKFKAKRKERKKYK